MTPLRRTPLFEAHRKLGARLVEFGGWEMPVQYSGIADEHHAVRKAAGLFDITHMGEVTITGPSAESFLNRVLTNDLSRLENGQGHYTLMCNERGGVIDDLYAYRTGAETFLLIINASRIEADMDWLNERFTIRALNDGTRLSNISEKTGALALQGPATASFIDSVFSGPSVEGRKVEKPTDLKKNEIAAFRLTGDQIWLGCTGYTGEAGFELITESRCVEAVWNRVLEAGKAHGLKPAGLGARDTLRTEMGYPLYGHELDENTTPIEAGLGWAVAFTKGDFCGRAAMEAQKALGIGKKCVAFKMTERSAPPRPGYPIWTESSNSHATGSVTSGTQSPSLGLGIGLGYVPPEQSKPGTVICIEIRGKQAAAEVVRKPIYKKPV